MPGLGTIVNAAAIILGGLVGSLLNIEGAMERFGTWLRKVTHSEGDGGSWTDSSQLP